MAGGAVSKPRCSVSPCMCETFQLLRSTRSLAFAACTAALPGCRRLRRVDYQQEGKQEPEETVENGRHSRGPSSKQRGKSLSERLHSAPPSFASASSINVVFHFYLLRRV